VQNAFLPRELGTVSSTKENFPAQITIVDLLRIFRVRLKIIIWTALAVVVLATVIVLQMTPLYTATAVVMLDQRKINTDTTDSALTGLPADQPTIQNQVQIINSLELANRVIGKLRLDSDPLFTPQADLKSKIFQYLNPLNWFSDASSQIPTSRQKHDAVLRMFLGGLSASPVGLSTTINISYQFSDPRRAAVIANAIADAYAEDQLEAKFQATQKTTQWLGGRIAELSMQAQTADAAVQKYKAEHHLSTSVGGVSVVDQQIRDVNSQMILAKANLAEKQANYNSLLSMQQSGHAANFAQVIASPLIATLRGQETELNRQIANLSTRYLPSHPKILDLQAQKENLDAKIKEEVQRIVESLRNDLNATSAHVASLQASLAQAENQGAGQDQTSVRLTALQSAAVSARSMYEAFLGRLGEIQDRNGIQTPDARVISRAQIPTSASFPKKSLTVGAAIPAGLVLGFLLAFLTERLDGGFRRPVQLEEMLDLPVLAVVPEVVAQGNDKSGVADLVVNKPTSAFAESIRGLHLGLMLSNVDQAPKVVLVTSSVPGEGKTAVAVSLARLAAASGLKTVLVDCDLRRPTTTRRIKQEYSGGLLAVLSDARPLDRCLTKDTKSSAQILPCLGTPPPSPSNLLTSTALQQLMEQLRDQFDFIVLDSPPVLPVNDAKILSRLADTVLFVVRWEKTPREAAASSIRALKDSYAHISGVALTRADSKRFRYYSYGYQDYQHYSKYYSE